jgi:hypothetical protein
MISLTVIHIGLSCQVTHSLVENNKMEGESDTKMYHLKLVQYRDTILGFWRLNAKTEGSKRLKHTGLHG